MTRDTAQFLQYGTLGRPNLGTRLACISTLIDVSSEVVIVCFKCKISASLSTVRSFVHYISTDYRAAAGRAALVKAGDATRSRAAPVMSQSPLATHGTSR